MEVEKKSGRERSPNWKKRPRQGTAAPTTEEKAERRSGGGKETRKGTTTACRKQAHAANRISTDWTEAERRDEPGPEIDSVSEKVSLDVCVCVILEMGGLF